MSGKKNIKRVPRDLDTNFDFRFGDKLKKSGEIIVAHSTSSNLLPEILKNGLSRESEKVWENTSSNKLFFEVEPTRTHYGENVYGWKSVQKHGGVPITLYVKVKQNQLRTDRDDADLGVKYQKNQKECTCDIPPEDILGLHFVGIDIAPKDFMEFYDMFSDDKMNYGGNLKKHILIHSAKKEHRDSIAKNGLHASKNPVVINGIFTFPEEWGHHKTSFDKKSYDYYEIILKDNAVIFWTDSDRPMDAIFGNGSDEYVQVYDKLIVNTSAKSREGVMQFISGFQSGDNKKWFDWKTEFSREMEKYLNENGYAGIQEGGQIVITDLNSIESIKLEGKNINIDFGNEKTKKMKNDNLYADGGNIDSQLDRSNAKPEEIMSDEVNFDTRKGLNRSEKVVPKDIVEEIETKGISLERLESLGLPIFKYQTQITVHGVFEGVGSGRVGGYKNLLSNQNQTLGIKYNAIDLEKKKIISKALRLDREFNQPENSFASRMDSRGFEIYKRKRAESKEEAIKVINELKQESNKIPSNFIGKKIVNAYSVFGIIIVELLIEFKAIKQENLWDFISAITDGRINNEESFTFLLEKENEKEKERSDKYKKEREEREAREKELLNKLKEQSTYSKSTSLPTSDEFIVAVVGTSYGDATLRVYSVFKNKTNRKVYSVQSYKSWSDVPTTISDEIKNSRGNKFYDETTTKLLAKYIEKGMLFDIYNKAPQKKVEHGSIYETKKTESLPDGDELLLDTDRYQLIKSKHTKTGDIIYLFKLKSRVEREDYKKIEANVKLIRGYYSSFVTAFVLKSAISENEAEMLLKGSSLEKGNQHTPDPNATIDNSKIDEAAKEAVNKLVDEKGITETAATEIVAKGVSEELEHHDTLKKVASGELTPEQAIVEIVVDHEKSNDDLKKQLTETELTLFNKALEKVGNVNLKRTIELADNIAKLEGKEHQDNLAFFAEALQYTTSDVENDVYARFWANDLEQMVSNSSSVGFEQLERAIEIGAIENGESLMDSIKAFRMAARTFRELKNEGHKAIIKNFVAKYMLANDELATHQDYIWSAINDLYKLIYFAKGNETDTSKISEYMGELITKYHAESKLEDFRENKSITETDNVNKNNEEYGSIEYTDGKYENGKDVYGANIRYKEQLAVIPLGRYETKQEVEERANKILAEFKSGELGDELQELIRQDATDEQKLFEKAKNEYAIVLEMSEGTSERNVGFDYLHQLENFIKKIGVSDRPTAIYLKNKVWFKDYPNDGDYSYVTIYSSYMKGDYNPETDKLMDYLKKDAPSFNWDIYEYGDQYKFGYQPEPEYKEGDVVKIMPEFGSQEDYSKISIEYNYGIVKKPTIYNRDESRWKRQWEYLVVDFFDDEKVYEDIREFRLKPITEDEIREELTERKIRVGEAEPLTKAEAEQFSEKYVNDINEKYEEYNKIEDKKNKYWSERLENEIYTMFYDWFTNVISRYPLSLGQWLNLQVEKLPNYERHLLNGFIDIDNSLTNLLQFFNSLNKLNIGKGKPMGIYELVPEAFLFDGKSPKQLNIEVTPTDDNLHTVMKTFISKDKDRPVLCSINFDKKGATATDANRLIFIKGKSDKIGIYGFGKIAEESPVYVKRGDYFIANKDVKYPDYQKVIPKEYSNVISVDRNAVEKIVRSMKSLKNVSYYNLYTDVTFLSFDKGKVSHFNLKYVTDLFEAWLKIGFDKLEIALSGSKNQILVVSPDISKFIDGLKGSGSIVMGVMVDESGQAIADTHRGQMYLDMRTGNVETAGITDDLFSEYNSAHGTYGAETESEEIEEMQMMIDLMEDTVKENPTEENQDYLDLLKETLIGLREKNKEKFNCGGKMYYNLGSLPIASPYNNGGNLFNDDYLSNIEKINKINNTLFYRYYPVGVNPFEVSFEESNKYGYGIYFLDNPYYYRNKFTDSRLLTIRPRLQNPFIFTEKSNRTPNGEYAEALLAAMKNDDVANRDAFTRKMIENGYDSLVAIEPRGTYLVMFSNDPDLYDIESDVSPEAMDEKAKIDFIEKINSSITSVLAENKYPDLNELESNFLYNTFKHTVISGQEQMPVWINNEGVKGSMKKSLLKKHYIDDHWVIFNKPMSYDRNEYSLDEKGKNFIKDVQEKFSSSKMNEGGTVNEIDNPRALGTALKKVFKKDYNIDIDTRYVKTVRGLDGSWYEISTFSSGDIIPNEVRKELLELSYGKTLSELAVSNPDNISYGNTREKSLSVYGKHWKEWLKNKKYADGGTIQEQSKQLKGTRIGIKHWWSPKKESRITDVIFENGKYIVKTYNYNLTFSENEIKQLVKKGTAMDSEGETYVLVESDGGSSNAPTMFLDTNGDGMIDLIMGEGGGFYNYTKETVKNIILNEGLLYAVKDYMDETPIIKSETELRSNWKNVRNKIREFENIARNEGYSPAYLIGNYNEGYKIISDPPYREVPVSSLSKEAQDKVVEINDLLVLIINRVGLDGDEFGKKYAKAGLIVDDNWGNDGSTASNNKYYNDLYAMFPDNHGEAKAIWFQLSEKQKEGFLNDLEVTDAASEHMKESWLEFINASSYQDWLDNATNWDEMAKGGSLKANDIPLDSWLEHKTTKTKVKVWNVDPQLGKMQIEDIYGNKDKQWRSASDWKLIPKPIKELEEIKKVWNEQGQVFEYAKGGEVDDYKFTYMMLGRLQTDNDYYLGHGNKSERNLWAGNVDDQIKEMKKLWNQLPENKKPEWLSMEEILEYEKKMKEQYAKGGVVENLEKELRKLQRDLNSRRLSTYMDGDNSEDEMARKKEREVKLSRFNEILRLLNENDSKQSKVVGVGEIKEGDTVKFIKKIDKKDVINGQILDIDETRIGFTNLDYPNVGRNSFSIYSLNKDYDIEMVKSKHAKGGVVDDSKEVWVISYLNKKKNFRRTDKEFKGEDSYEKAVDWGKKNLENFHIDMVRKIFFDGGILDEVNDDDCYMTNLDAWWYALKPDTRQYLFEDGEHDSTWDYLDSDDIWSKLSIERKKQIKRAILETGNETQVKYALNLLNQDRYGITL